MATYKTYDMVGIAEDVSDIISNITPTKTPFQAAIGSEKVSNTVFEWQEDSIRDAADNAQIEGADAVDSTRTPTVMRLNRTQIMSETVKVSRTSSRVKTYGRKREMAYQMEKASKGLKRDKERAFIGNAQDTVAGDDATARKLASYQRQIATANIEYTGASDGTAPLTEQHLLNALQKTFSAGAEPDRVQVTPNNSLVVADFAKASGRYRTFDGAKDKTVVNVVNLYVSPFGEQKVEINRNLKAGNTLIFEAGMWAEAVLDPWMRVPLAKSGDYDRQMIIGEFSLKHKNWSGSGLIVEAASGF